MAEARRGPRAIWSGTVSFGLVSVPVELYPAGRATRTPLRMLAPDGTPLRRQYVCPAEDRPLSAGDLARGYELDDGSFVLVSDDELESVAPDKSRDLALTSFVPRDELDPVYFQRPYVLAPRGESTRAYHLLAAAMERSGRVGVAHFVLRGVEHAVALLAEDGLLTAEILRFADEVRDGAEIDAPDAGAAPAARRRALGDEIDALTADEIDREVLVDGRAAELAELAESKREEGAVVDAPGATPDDDDEVEDDIIDLMQVLKQRLGQGAKPAARARRADGGDGADDDLRRLTKRELYERAAERDVHGRSSMTKDQLIAALQAG